MTTGPATTLPHAMRADARRNYDRLLATAKEVFAEHGSEASLDDIARRAGVGIGTLYRHFPNRQALLEAIFRDEFDALRSSADELLDSPSPLDALARWLRAQLVHAGAYRGLAGSVMIAMLDEGSKLSSSMAAMHAAGSALLARAQETGNVRADLDIASLLKLVCAIGVATEQAPDGADQAERLLSIMLDGLRPHDSEAM